MLEKITAQSTAVVYATSSEWNYLGETGYLRHLLYCAMALLSTHNWEQGGMSAHHKPCIENGGVVIVILILLDMVSMG